METTFIYGLNDPETGECRYVGKANDPKRRRWDHVSTTGKKYHCTNWINSLKARGLRPVLEILQEVPFAEWKTWERAWIKASRLIGMDLTNHTDGGDGLCNPSLEVRKKLGKFGKDHRLFGKGPMLGKKHNPESLAKMRAAKIGKKLSLEHRAKLCERRPSSETRAKMRVAQQRRRANEIAAY